MEKIKNTVLLVSASGFLLSCVAVNANAAQLASIPNKQRLFVLTDIGGAPDD